MIQIDKEKFEKIVLAATSATATVFDMMPDRIAISTSKLKSVVFGSAKDMDKLPDEVTIEVERFICMDAFYDAIPGLDLVLTATGFGIVNNQNLSPASKDRVETLRKSVRQSADDAMDAIICRLIGGNEWAESAYARLLINSLFYTGNHLRSYAGKPDAHRSQLLELRPIIAEAEEIIRRRISAVMFVHLLKQIRLDELSDFEQVLVTTLRNAVGFFINKQGGAFKNELEVAVNLMENNLSEFQVYTDSEAYKVNHFEYYKNEKDDSCYFFG